MTDIDSQLAGLEEMPPFTDFGWAGKNRIDLRVFEQDTYWIDIKGRAHRIDSMDVSYLHNVLGFLFRNAPVYHYDYAKMKVNEATLAAAQGHMHAEVLATAIGESVAHISTSEWLLSTPLYRKIEAMLALTD